MNAVLVKYATLLFLLVGFAFTAGSAVSYRQEVTLERDVELVTIGTPVKVNIDDLNANSELRLLVPFGYVYKENEVEKIVLSYEISVSKELLNSVDLLINVDEIRIDGFEEYTHLVDIKVLGSSGEVRLDLYNSTLLVTVEVTILEPIDMEEAIEEGLDLDLVNVDDSFLAFNYIKGKDITFRLTFELQIKEQFIEEPTLEPTN